jgi:hypothetical protein
LITLTLVAPAETNSTVNSVCSAAAAPPSAATATGAAADTLNFSSIALTKSFNYKIVAVSNSATMFSMFNAIVISSDNFCSFCVIYSKLDLSCYLESAY